MQATQHAASRQREVTWHYTTYTSVHAFSQSFTAGEGYGALRLYFYIAKLLLHVGNVYTYTPQVEVRV